MQKLREWYQRAETHAVDVRVFIANDPVFRKLMEGLDREVQ